MAEVVKIKEIYLCTAFCDTVGESWEVYKYLKDNNIPFTHLHWNTPADVQPNLDSMNTAPYSVDGENVRRNVGLTKLPCVHWMAVYDNDEKYLNFAKDLAELQTSQVIVHKDKIVTPPPIV